MTTSTLPVSVMRSSSWHSLSCWERTCGLKLVQNYPEFFCSVLSFILCVELNYSLSPCWSGQLREQLLDQLFPRLVLVMYLHQKPPVAAALQHLWPLTPCIPLRASWAHGPHLPPLNHLPLQRCSVSHFSQVQALHTHYFPPLVQT